MVFNTDHIVNLGNSNSILSLALSAGIDLDTNTHDLTIDGLLELVDSGTNLFIGDSASLVQADSVTINSNGEIRLEGGELRVVEETGKGLLHIKSGGTLFGRGTIVLNDSFAHPTVLLRNDGSLVAVTPSLGMPAAGTLRIQALDIADARIDLDGAYGSGLVDVGRNQTLDINVVLSDAFAGGMSCPPPYRHVLGVDHGRWHA